MKIILILFAVSVISTISCRKAVNNFERLSVKACGCISQECAEDAFEDYKNLAMKYVHKKDFRKNMDYIYILSEDISDCLISNGINRYRIKHFYNRIQDEVDFY